MGYKRATWHSGYTYRQTCPKCQNEMLYTDHQLGFRAWFPDGFVYCTRCKAPLRHNECYAIDSPAAKAAPQIPAQAPVQTPVQAAPAADAKRFCSQCGKLANPGDRFCSGCGAKLI